MKKIILSFLGSLSICAMVSAQSDVELCNKADAAQKLLLTPSAAIEFRVEAMHSILRRLISIIFWQILLLYLFISFLISLKKRN